MLKKGILLIMVILMIISCGKDSEDENGSVTIAEADTTAVAEPAEGKKPLTPDAYAEWERLSRPTIAENGKWIHYTASPNRGDNLLTLYGVESGKKHDFERVKKVSFSPANDFITFMRTPAFETERRAKLDKVKKDKMPKDSLCVYFFEDDTLLTVPRVKSYSINDEGRPGSPCCWKNRCRPKRIPQRKRTPPPFPIRVCWRIPPVLILPQRRSKRLRKKKRRKKKKNLKCANREHRSGYGIPSHGTR
ncbi:MAG: hypothetical protein U5N56_10535 [Candidatus Marinimicrobia bacterium]|nr:hypothetical protein [Candidatus Neomarinimicrobiota bacterium]